MEPTESENNALEMHTTSTTPPPTTVEEEIAANVNVDKENTALESVGKEQMDVDESSQPHQVKDETNESSQPFDNIHNLLQSQANSASESSLSGARQPIELGDASILTTVPSLGAKPKRNVAVKNSQALLTTKITQMKSRLNSTSSVSSITLNNNEHVIIVNAIFSVSKSSFLKFFF